MLIPLVNAKHAPGQNWIVIAPAAPLPRTLTADRVADIAMKSPSRWLGYRTVYRTATAGSIVFASEDARRH